MIPGRKIVLGDKEFVIPPLSLGQLRGGIAEKLAENDRKSEAGNYTELLFLRAEIIIAALRRNYPESEHSDEDLFNRLDFGNWLPAWQAVLAVSGLGLGEETATEINGQNTASSTTILPSPPPMAGPMEQSIN